VRGRIWFPGNPWPEGHRVTEFLWTGRLDRLGWLWFDLTLKTAGYDEEFDAPDSEDEDISDWAAPVVWNNYHACTLSSTWDDATGLLAATPERPFRLADPLPQRLTADPLPIEDLDAPPAFHVYLLGHDTVADHTVTFTGDGSSRHRIDWTGRIALSYVGDEEFRYEFRAEIHDAGLAHIALPDGMSGEEGRRHLTHLLGVPERFMESAVDGQLVLRQA
jgi:hypothetical protein